MKSLQESLFDTDLVNQDHPIEKLKKYLSKKPNWSELMELALGMSDGDFDAVRNTDLKQWAEDIYDKYYTPNVGAMQYRYQPLSYGVLEIAGTKWSGKIHYLLDQEAMDWLKFGTIHNDVCWNDKMYTNQFEIPHYFWNDRKGYNNDIYEWVIVNHKWEVVVIANRHSYDKTDQDIVHSLIEFVSKYYKKGTR